MKPKPPVRQVMETVSSGGVGTPILTPRQVSGLPSRFSGRVRKAAAVLAAAGLMAVVSLGTAVPSQASGSSSGLNSEEVLNCSFNAKACVYANDAKKWAESITEWKFPIAQESNHNTRSDAFRHCSWSAALSNRVGFDTAWQILSTHETSAKRQPEAELRMDMANNYTGARIGLEARSKGGNDQWGWIMNKCEKLARAGQLEVLR
ncbi:DUF6973 domain-containing protein [Paenarthrobacter sp. NPDC057981]|uniref:DUF6973 domain-containing protein n=1 Tax=Paenarthrobacter sp. NPDC057981 TaxID=3346297 RepID=UPI0036DC3F89